MKLNLNIRTKYKIIFNRNEVLRSKASTITSVLRGRTKNKCLFDWTEIHQSRNSIIRSATPRWIKANNGVTLTETLIYIVLFGIIFLAIMQFLFTMNEGNRVATYRNEIDRSIIFLNEHLNDSFDLATSIDGTGSTFDNDSSILNLVTDEGTVSYRLVNGTVIYNTNSEDFLLTSPRTTTTKLLFQKILNSDDELIGVRMTLEIESVFDSKSKKTIETSYALKQ